MNVQPLHNLPVNIRILAVKNPGCFTLAMKKSLQIIVLVLLILILVAYVTAQFFLGSLVKAGVNKTEAEEISKKLKEAGAEVELK